MDYLPKPYHTKIWRAIYEHELIEAGDRIAVGLSGGKDSMFACYALSAIRRYSKIPFSLSAITIDLGFEQSLDRDALEQFCSALEISFHYIPTRIADIIRAREQQESPCAVCSYLRRAALHRFASAHGYNKVVFAHHQDDAMETFLMNILFSGRVGTLPWKTHLTKTGIVVIRPLMYLSERDIAKAVRRLGLRTEPNVCPYSCETHRARTKELIRDLCREHKQVRANLISAMRSDRLMELWPASGRLNRSSSS